MSKREKILGLVTVVLYGLTCIAFLIAAIVSISHNDTVSGIMFVISAVLMLIGTVVLLVMHWLVS